MKKVILSADDFAINKNADSAIVEALNNGILTSSCIMANGENYDETIQKIKKGNYDIGIHLNIIENKALIKIANNPLTDDDNCFNNSFLSILLNSMNKKYLKFVENEFRAQIEKVMQDGIKPSYISSHVHVHAIPNIFKICLKLAQEYDIKAIRTQSENFYFASDVKKHFKFLYFINIIKHILLNFFSFINKFALRKTNIKTNDSFAGVLYTLNMDKSTIIPAIKKLKDGIITEIILHPNADKTKENSFIEYKTVLNSDLKKEFSNLHVKLISWADI